MTKSTVLFVTFLLDKFLKDPSFCHPVRIIGALGSLGFRLFAKWGRFGGFLTVVLCVLVVELLVLGSVKILKVFELLWLFYFIALHCLVDEVYAVYDFLRKGDLVSARRRLSFLVSRDTEEMSVSEVVRGALETLSENFNDAFCGPVFWYSIGGIGLCAFYKVVETLDSMFGYLHEPFRRFGYFPAKLDDLMNYIPARLSALFLALAAPFVGGSFRETVSVAFRDASKHTSPNAGWPEAAASGALRVRLGGPTRYRGRLFKYPYLGEEFSGGLEPEDILRGIKLIKRASYLYLGFWILVLLGTEVFK